MPLMDMEIKNNIAFVRMKNGVTNAVSPELIADLSGIMAKTKDDAAAMILTGNDRFFSMGFDLPRVMEFDRPKLGAYLADFQDMIFQMAFLPLPVIAALTGHAVAGGAILAIVCDYRIAKSEKFRIGFNESLLGLTLPYLAELMLERFTGSRICGRLMLEGSLIKAENAISLGLIDDICPLDGVMERAVQKARQLMEIPGETFAAMKDNHLAAVREKYLARIGPRTEQFMDLWFAKETQKRLAKAMEKF
ncbi:MAG: enoyl-CoA hydratase/isomerase family protein [Desulfobacula sp.]|nr:enoyl-CoA hydratase/isomerase family protein [Desulfobacula sp.]